MISKKFPAQSLFYKNYPLRLQKSDARRYFILYKYGGVFADLDMESTLELSGLLRRYSCVLAQQPLADSTDKHPRFSRGWFLSNDFMACRPGHPFFKLIIDKLAQAQVEHGVDLLNTTGPYFLSAVLEEYLSTANRTADEFIHVIPTQWMTSAYAGVDDATIAATCSGDSIWLDQIALCGHLMRNQGGLTAAASYYWHHLFGAHFVSKSFMSIYQVLPKIYII